MKSGLTPGAKQSFKHRNSVLQLTYFSLDASNIIQVNKIVFKVSSDSEKLK